MSIVSIISDRAWPAWVWDPARPGIFAANKAALVWWDIEGAFDPADLLFKASDPISQSLSACLDFDDGEEFDLQLSLPFHPPVQLYRCHTIRDQGQRFVLLEAPGGSETSKETDAPESAPLWSQALADLVPLPFLLCEADGEIVAENAEARLRLGTSENRPTRLSALFPSHHDALALTSRIMRQGRCNEVASIYTRDGISRAQVMAYRVLDEVAMRHRLFFALNFLRSGRRIVQPEVDAASEKWREAVEKIAPAAFELDAIRKIIYFSPSMPRLINKTPDRIGGRLLGETGAILDPRIERGLKSESAWEGGRMLWRHDDGSSLALETHGEPVFGNDDDLRGFRIIGIPVAGTRDDDVQSTLTTPQEPQDLPSSEEKLEPEEGLFPARGNLVRLDDWRPADEQSVLTETEFASIVNELDAALLGLDDSGRIRFANKAALETLEMSELEVRDRPLPSLFEKSFGALLGTYIRAPQNPTIAATFLKGATGSLVDASGDETTLIVRMHPLRERSPIRYCAFLQDAHKRSSSKTPEKALLGGEELDEKEKRDFLANFSHEIRTPLNAIIGFCDLIRQEKFGPLDNPKYREYIQDIHESGQLMLSLVDDVLALSKAENATLGRKLLPMDIRPVINMAVRLVASQADARGIHVNKNLDPHIPIILADERSVLQIVLNILTNAIKYTDRGGDVLIAAHKLESGRIRVRFQDTGIGMSQKDLRLALRPFGRTASATRKGVQGTGLGLPLVKALAQANRAQFSIESEPDSGTLVRIDFCAAQAVAE